MRLNIRNGDLVICSNSMKRKILNDMSKQGKFVSARFISMDEFKKRYFGSYDIDAVYYLMSEYGFKYEVAKDYLDNIFYDYDLVRPYYKELMSKGLLKKDNLFRKSFKRCVVVGYEIIDPFVRKELDKYNSIYVLSDEGFNKPIVYGFDKQYMEVSYVAGLIAEKLRSHDISDICLVGVRDEYVYDIKRIFRMFNIPVNVDNFMSIYGTNSTRVFLDKLGECGNVGVALEAVPKGRVYDKIVSVLNESGIVGDVDDKMMEIVDGLLKEAVIRKERYSKGIEVVSYDDMRDEKFYYWLGFNEGSAPMCTGDTLFIKDKDRKELGLYTSLERNSLEKETVLKSILGTSNLVISYKLSDNYDSYYPSSLIAKMDLSVIYNPKMSFGYSDKYNKEYLGMLIDGYFKYGQRTDDFDKLLGSYDVSYGEYDNSFKGIDIRRLYDYLGGEINLSYTSMNNYCLCGFRFYISNVLRLDPFEESFSAMIGSLFHECLSHMYDDDFDLKRVYDGYLEGKELSNKERFFVSKLYDDLKFVIKAIRKQDEYSSFDRVMCEKKIMVDKSSKLKVNFVGFVDKIRYMEKDGKRLFVIVDYKTGNVVTNLDNINYGLHLQLPVYIYLIKREFKDAKIVGFYLQKILNSVDMDGSMDDLYKKLRLDGYTINDPDLISLFDSNYESSKVIKGMARGKNGFYAYSKVVSDDEVDCIDRIVTEDIDRVISGVESGDFGINPKSVDGKNVGCEFCEFSDLCFRKEKDIVSLEGRKFKDIISSMMEVK